jgi:hypothetical protein
MIRLSRDAKAIVTVGPLARGGKSRVPTIATDHDLHPDATVTPVGLFLPALDELFLYGMTSKVTRDCLVDGLGRWWEVVPDRFAPIPPWVIHLDNGPEHHSRRTPGRQRMVELAHHTGLTVRLASYPPYHSQYNPGERCWGILENHWNGARLDAIDAVIQCATTMTGKGKSPVVDLVTTTYQTGVKLTKAAMQMVETRLQRLPGLDTWFVDIVPTSSTIRAP